MNRGFVCIWRKVADSQSWSRGLLHRGLLVTLIVKANWKKGYFMGKPIKAGQLAIGTNSLAEELQASRSSVYRALQDLQKDGFITVQNVNNRFTLITLVNWHTYQDISAKDEQPMNNQRTTSGHNQTIKPLNKKESALFLQSELMEPSRKTQLQGKKSSSEDFDTFWQAYPRKVGKGNARTAWTKLQKQGALPELSILLEAVERQRKSRQWQDPSYIPHPSTWLNGERWSDGQDEASGGVCGTASRPEWAQNMGAIL